MTSPHYLCASCSARFDAHPTSACGRYVTSEEMVFRVQMGTADMDRALRSERTR